jgi:hypothetical protein
VADKPVLGGAVNMAADIATDPVQLGALALGGGPLVAGGLLAAATAVEQPGATVQDVAVQAAVGAVLNKAAPLVGKVAGPAATQVVERAGPIVKAVYESPVGKFMLEESGAVGP